MTLRDIELFNDSYERCTAIKNFLPRFYQVFIASSPEVAEKFKDTDFRRQVRALKASLYLMLVAVQGYPEGVAHLERMAQIHSKGKLEVAPYLYDLWLSSLLTAVREIDVQWSPDIEHAWIAVLTPGIEYMKSYYRGDIRPVPQIEFSKPELSE